LQSSIMSMFVIYVSTFEGNTLQGKYL